MAEEVRVVCKQFGQAGHSQHTHPKANMAKAKQSVIDSEHHVEMHPTPFYRAEMPYRIQTREVTPWKDWVDPAKDMDKLFDELKEDA